MGMKVAAVVFNVIDEFMMQWKWQAHQPALGKIGEQVIDEWKANPNKI